MDTSIRELPKEQVVEEEVVLLEKDKETVETGKEDEYVDEWESVDEEDEEEEYDEDAEEDETEEDKEDRKYSKKIARLREMMKLPPVQENKQKNTKTKSNANVPVKTIPVLPASSDAFMNLFDMYVDDVKGKPTSTKKKNNSKDTGQFPSLFTPKMKFYEVEDCPWKENFLDSDKKLYHSALYSFNGNPEFKMSHVQQLLNWEGSNRKSLNVCSYVDNFLWGVMKHLKVMKRKLKSRQYEEEPSLSIEHIEDLYWQVGESLNFLDSAAKGLNDLIKMTINRIGSQVLIRRDNWFNNFTTVPSSFVTSSLRQSDLNNDGLFGEALLLSLLKDVKDDKQDDVQDAFLRGFQGADAGASTGGRGRSRGRGRGAFRSRGGRGFRGNRGRGRAGLWNFNNQSNQVRYNFNSNRRANRGNPRGRSSGRGRGASRGGQGGQA